MNRLTAAALHRSVIFHRTISDVRNATGQHLMVQSCCCGYSHHLEYLCAEPFGDLLNRRNHFKLMTTGHYIVKLRLCPVWATHTTGRGDQCRSFAFHFSPNTHTHTQRERERERLYFYFLKMLWALLRETATFPAVLFTVLRVFFLFFLFFYLW